MKKGKNDITRSILYRDQFREDGKTIGRLQREKLWLAHQLAMSGAMPLYTPDAGRSAEEVEVMAAEWISAAERVIASEQQTA